jgi:DNA modification methylase
MSSEPVCPVSEELKIVYQPIKCLKPDPSNPRIHTKKQLKQLAKSIETFRFNIPVVTDGSGKVIAGHGRIEACKLLGIKQVPTIKLSHLTEAQVQAFRIADNRLTEIASWDDQLLGEQLKVLSELNLDFELDATGFEVAEIDLRIQGLEQSSKAELDVADQIPDGGKVQVTRLGDVWSLGKHRVLCGNALNRSSYEVLMGEERAHCAFTDPPYNVPIEHHASGKGEIKHGNFLMASGEMTEAEFTAFLAGAFELLAAYSTDGALIYACMDWRHIPEVLTAGKKAFSELKNLCIWAKDRGGMGSFYRSQHELVFVFKRGAGAHRNNVQLGKFGRTRSNVWNYPSVTSFGRSGEEGNLLSLHPTVKPVAMVADAIMDCSARGDIVLDPFLGSGTTVIAAERVGRVCYGMELDPVYIDTAIRRWQTVTGRVAVHAESGLTFSEREVESEKNGK